MSPNGRGRANSSVAREWNISFVDTVASHKVMDATTTRRAKVSKELSSKLIYWEIKRQVKNEILKPQYAKKDLSTLIPKVMEDMGLTTKLRNSIYEIYHRTNGGIPSTKAAATSNKIAGGALGTGKRADQESELDTIKEARRQWEEGICEELNALGLEQHRPLARSRANITTQGEKIRSFVQGTDASVGASTRRFLFDSEDLLEAIAAIDSPNHSSNVTRIQSWGMIRVLLKTPDITELRSIFSELHPSMSQIGLDDALEGNDKWFQDRCALGEKILSAGYIAVIRQYAKRGIPAGLRSKMWRKMLNLELSQAERNYFDMLQSQVDEVDILVDQLFHMDVEHAVDDDSYFPFEKELDDTVMAFSRDPWVLGNCANRVHPPLIGRTIDGHNVGIFPPGGVQPFRGLVSYAAPLCFIYHEPAEIYYIFREMFSQLWCKLNSINSERSCIVMLSKLFEDLIQRFEPELFRHLLDVGISPLALSFSWIQLAFVGYLQTDQLLLLWDRVLAEGDRGLMLLPILAASIFVYRSHALMKARDVQEARAPC